MQFLMFCVDNHAMNQNRITFEMCIFDTLFFRLSSLGNSARFSQPTSVSAVLFRWVLFYRTCVSGALLACNCSEGWEVVPPQTLLVALFHNSNIPNIVLSPFIFPVVLPLSKTPALSR